MSARPPYSVVKLDRRFTGRDFFVYSLDYRYGREKIDPFLAHRNWFWETFGPSAEFNLWEKVHSDSPNISCRWAWETNYDQRRIYVRDEETLSPFLLTFG